MHVHDLEDSHLIALARMIAEAAITRGTVADLGNSQPEADRNVSALAQGDSIEPLRSESREESAFWTGLQRP